MSGKGYPAQQYSELRGEFVADAVSCLNDLAIEGIPANAEELTKRITDYFNFCADRGFRPGVESLCLALGTSRQNFARWCTGAESKGEKWRSECNRARQIIFSFIEQCGINGKISPPVLIWLQKNWCGYSDAITIENITGIEERTTSVSEFPVFDLPGELVDARKE